MSFIFSRWPTVDYDFKKNGKKTTVTNVTLRFKLSEALRTKSAVMYEYNVKNGERPDIIAAKYYGDASLDWLILLANNIIDPQWEWPLDDRSFDNYIRGKYGSIEAAQRQVHHYEKILRASSVTFDGIRIPEKTLWIGIEQYADEISHGDPTRATHRTVYAYDYELEQNDNKAIIKILDKQFVNNIVSQYETAIEDARD